MLTVRGCIIKCSLAAYLAWFGHALPASAESTASPATQARAGSRVLLIGTARSLEAALRTALAPWGLSVRRLESRRVELELQSSSPRAAALADELGADALIWFSAGAPSGTSLWLYDAGQRTTSARPLPNGVVDARLSAALALSIKTALRSPAVPSAKTAQQAEAEAAAPAIAPETHPLSSDVPLDADPRTSSAGSRAAQLRLAVSAALRGGALSQGVTELRYGVELRWAPWARSLWEATDLWLSARFDLGHEPSIVRPSFNGRYSQIEMGLAVGVSRRWGRFVDGGAQLGASLDHGSLSGTLSSDATPATQSRFGASVFLRPELAFSAGPLALLLQPGLQTALGRQRYVADGQVVLETGQFSWLLGAGLRLSVP